MGTPRAPSDLGAHTLIVGPAGHGSIAWSFRKSGETTTVRAEGRIVIDIAEAATAAAVVGLGILSTGYGGVQAEIENGSLVRLLQDWEMDRSDMNVILPAGRSAKASARAFADFIAREVREIEAFAD